MGIRIKGTGSYLPEKILTNADLEQMVDTSDEWIRTRTGIQIRHIAAPEQASSDLAAMAAKRALEAAGITGADLDGIVIASITPDHNFPNTASLVQHQIGAQGCFCCDVSAACSGLLYGIEMAYCMMKTRPERYRNVLVLGAETISRIVNWSDRNTCVLFGDGSGGVVLQNDGDENTPDFLLASDIHADGNYSMILNVPASGSRMPATHETVDQHLHSIRMNGRDTFKLAVNAMVESSKKVLQMADMSSEDVRMVIPHQANQRIIQAVAQRLDVTDDRVYSNIAQIGNTSAASIGIGLDDIVRTGRVQKGDRLLLTAFGGGLTWGAMLVDL